jgi:hypothetical protein
MGLLWNPESWAQRLAELQAESGELKEAPLRRDVRSLGMLLGEVLRRSPPRCMRHMQWRWCINCRWSERCC